MSYTYPQFNLFLKAASKAWSHHLSDMTWSSFVGNHADNKKLQEVLHSLRG